MKEPIFEDFIPRIFYHVFRRCNPGWRVHPHFVEGYEITYLVEGSACYTINGISHELLPGDMLWLAEGDEKKAITYPNNLMHCFSVNFVSLFPQLKSTFPPFPTVNHVGLRKDIIDLFREMTFCWSKQQKGYILKTRALLMLIINRFMEIVMYNIDSSTGDHRINKATQTITMHYSDKLTVRELANKANLDEAYFGQLFKKETGMTVRQYIAQIRIRNAENMLQRGDFKVHEVAEHCGFSDVMHFYKQFRTLRGFPPSKLLPKKR